MWVKPRDHRSVGSPAPGRGDWISHLLRCISRKKTTTTQKTTECEFKLKYWCIFERLPEEVEVGMEEEVEVEMEEEVEEKVEIEI